jgi:hypothetical protein
MPFTGLQSNNRAVLVKHPIQNFTKIRPAGSKLLHADGWTDQNDETNSSFFATLSTQKERILQGISQRSLLHSLSCFYS